MNLVDRIIKFEENNSLTKSQGIVKGVIDAIENEDLHIGSQLPSINQMVFGLKYARKTIVKGYEDLKRRGLVKSTRNKGYFIVSKDTKTRSSIALVLSSFRKYEEVFYNTFRNELGDKFFIDIFFHHDKTSSFERVLYRIKQSIYDKYIVESVRNNQKKCLLENFDPDKLLVINNHFPIDDNTFKNEDELLMNKYEEMGKQASKFVVGDLKDI